MTRLQDRYSGAFVGLAIGDTLGMFLEFKYRGEFEPITGPEAGGPFDLPLGYWTDDTSMALCLADSLLEMQGYDSFDVMDKYSNWERDGYRSSTGVCFDIGNQVSTALHEYERGGYAIIPADKQRLSSAGNGSIMRLAPLVIASHGAGNSLEETMEMSRISARETHYSLEAEAGTALFAALIWNAFTVTKKSALFTYGGYPQDKAFEMIAEAVRTAGNQKVETINPTGYIVDSLIAAVWAFFNFDSFEAGALAAVNLGGDADTIGAVYGQLAGAYYGYDAIPVEWRNILYLESEIVGLAERLADMEQCAVQVTRFEEDGPAYTSRPQVSILQGDITKIKVDAIVNAANTKLLGGGGVCGAIFAAAGDGAMTEACEKIGHCEFGEAAITPGFDLPAKWVIHTVGPVYGHHDGNDADILASCYWQSLRLAQDKHLRTMAFPLISSGIYGYPKQEAVEVAIASIREFFEDNPHTSLRQVILMAYTEEDARLIQFAL